MRFFIFIAIIAGTRSALGLNGPCGGLLESDAGEYQKSPEDPIEPGQVCVWIVKLISRTTVQFNLTELGEGLTVSLYPEHSPSQLSIRPTRLNSSNEGMSIENPGQTLVVVLTQTGSGQGFAFTWDSLASTGPGLLTAANYIDAESGHVLWDRLNSRERLTLSLNTQPSQSFDIEANADIRDCSLVNHCQCSYVAVYEFRSDGYLREVSVICGRTSQVKLQNLFPNILAFVYLNSSYSVSAKDYAEIKWNASKLDLTSTTMSASTTTLSTTDLPVKIYTQCGGAVEVGPSGSIIDYFPQGGYSNDEFCVWSFLSTKPYNGFSIDLVSYGMEIYYDGITIYSWNVSGIITTKRIEQTDYNSTISVNQPYAAVAFTSDYMGPSRGFQVTITGTGDLEGEYRSQALFLNQTEGSFSYPADVLGLFNYEPNKRVTVVVQPPSLKTRTVVSLA